MLSLSPLQLCDTLYLENPNVDVELIDVENEGNCIKFSPLDTSQGVFVSSISHRNQKNDGLFMFVLIHQLLF